MRPKRSIVASTQRRSEAAVGRIEGHRQRSRARPAPAAASRASARPGSRTSPRSRRRLAIASPMPRLAPEIIAVRGALKAGLRRRRIGSGASDRQVGLHRQRRHVGLVELFQPLQQARLLLAGEDAEEALVLAQRDGAHAARQRLALGGDEELVGAPLLLGDALLDEARPARTGPGAGPWPSGPSRCSARSPTGGCRDWPRSAAASRSFRCRSRPAAEGDICASRSRLSARTTVRAWKLRRSAKMSRSTRE